MYKSSAASRARGEPTTPKLRPLELSPDMAPPSRPNRWIQPAAEPRHRTTRPIKSALKRSGSQAPPPPERPSCDVDGDSGYGSGSSNDHRSNGFIVHVEPLGPPGVSETPQRPTRPLGDQDSNRLNPNSQMTQRSERDQASHPAQLAIPPEVQAPVHPAGRPYRYDEITPPAMIGRGSHHRPQTVSEKLPQNTSSAEQYEPISSVAARTPRGNSHSNYGPIQDLQYPSHYRGVPPTGYSIYAPPPHLSQEQYQQHYQSQYYQASKHPRRPSGVENDAGLSDNEGRRPYHLLPRPQKYMPDGYSSDTGGMSQYYTRTPFGAVAPQDLQTRPPPLEKEQQCQQRYLQQQPQPPAGWVRYIDVLGSNGLDNNGHPIQVPTSTNPAIPSASTLVAASSTPAFQRPQTVAPRNGQNATSQPRGWTEPPLLRGVALSWPILEYKQRRRGSNIKPMVFFDISQDPDGTDGRGIRLLSPRDCGMDKDFPDEYKTLPFSTQAKMRYIDMKCTAPELQPWNVVIEHWEGDGIQVIDFFRAIYRTYQQRLTPDELYKYRDLVNSKACQRAFKRRCRKAPGLTEYNERQGIRRVDLVGDRTLYLRLHCESDTKRYEFDVIQQNQDNICASQLAPYRT